MNSLIGLAFYFVVAMLFVLVGQIIFLVSEKIIEKKGSSKNE